MLDLGSLHVIGWTGWLDVEDTGRGLEGTLN